MKKSKKIVSLLLALAFAFSLMATTALAAGDVQPRYPVTKCFRCDGAVRSMVKKTGSAQVLVTCPHYASPHYHTGKKDYYEIACDNCGRYEELIRVYDFEDNCPYDSGLYPIG